MGYGVRCTAILERRREFESFYLNKVRVNAETRTLLAWRKRHARTAELHGSMQAKSRSSGYRRERDGKPEADNSSNGIKAERPPPDECGYTGARRIPKVRAGCEKR